MREADRRGRSPHQGLVTPYFPLRQLNAFMTVMLRGTPSLTDDAACHPTALLTAYQHGGELNQRVLFIVLRNTQHAAGVSVALHRRLLPAPAPYSVHSACRILDGFAALIPQCD